MQGNTTDNNTNTSSNNRAPSFTEELMQTCYCASPLDALSILITLCASYC